MFYNPAQILTTLICCLFATMAAAADHSIHIEWGYTPPSEPSLSGYNLYQEGTLACSTRNPERTAMDCQVSLEKDTTNFTLTATFSDGSESPHSTPFPFTIADDAVAAGDTPSTTETSTSDTTETAQTVTSDSSGSSATSATDTYTSTTTSSTLGANNVSFAIEIGEVEVNHNWKRVELEHSFTNPVIIAGPPSYNGNAPGVIRLRNIDSTGFEIQFAEWDYLDGYHATETVSYLAVEKGHHTVDGTTIEAGSLTGTTSFKTTSFQTTFSNTPIVMTTIASINEPETIAGRIRNVSSSGFQYYFTEQEANANTHTKETVNYLAWEEGNGLIDAINVEASYTANAITHDWEYVDFQNTTEQLPFLFADLQTTNGSDVSATRMRNPTETRFQVKVEEEQSKDSEVNHTTEVIGYLIFTSGAQR
ncbi:hypothetical protein [Desulfogranum marinum]|uniref:hypothetical protein n=1 Tax=Desulfogranum marinum TaxID=453220 RepID=UPI0029C807CC|nr:hypothetical protein [Desulfogranum marinum]